MTAIGDPIFVTIAEKRYTADAKAGMARQGREADMTTVPLDRLRRRWLREPAFREAYEALAPEFEIAAQLIAARSRAGLTQADVAKRMGTTQSVVARLESGRQRPSLDSLERYAKATGSQLRVELIATGKGAAKVESRKAKQA
jgi:ribosome-binding protein aMBF1 (putative translation factor)